MRTEKNVLPLPAIVETPNPSVERTANGGARLRFFPAAVPPSAAYREFLKEQEKNGAFQILNNDYEKSFWKYFTNDSMHTFYPDDMGTKLMKTPWWLMDKPIEE